MKAYRLLGLLSALTVLSFLTGCKRDDKVAGPAPILPESGVQLMFADCNPFRLRVGLQEDVTLTSDPLYACDGSVQFVEGQEATWVSGVMQIPPGTYSEGYHLAFTRNLHDAQSDIAVIRVNFQGIATQFTVVDTMPVGTSGDAVRKVLEVAQTGTTPDSLRPVRISIACLNGSFVADLNRDASGSYLKIGVGVVSVCELKILNNPQHGQSYNLHEAFDVTYAHSSGTITDTVFLDYTGGASVTNHRVTLGDHHGVAYLASRSEGGCRDTASFWALPSAQSFTTTILGYYPIGNIISDGTTVWFLRLYQAQHDSIPCRVLYVTEGSYQGTPLIVQPVYNCTDTISVNYDRPNRRIWVTENSSALDSAWSYDLQGRLDTAFAAANIPVGILYQGLWVQTNGSNALSRNISELPFAGTSAVVNRNYPAELTDQFAGGAGVGLPGAGRSTTYSVNTFDGSGFWTGQFPVQVGDSDQVESVNIVMADSIIVYSIAGNFQGVGLAQLVRALLP